MNAASATHHEPDDGHDQLTVYQRRKANQREKRERRENDDHYEPVAVGSLLGHPVPDKRLVLGMHGEQCAVAPLADIENAHLPVMPMAPEASLRAHAALSERRSLRCTRGRRGNGHGLGRSRRLGTLYRNPVYCISSHVWSPHFTSLVGSGLCSFDAELSYQAIEVSLPPAGISSGAANR